MVGRVRKKGTGYDPLVLGNWVPSGNPVTCNRPSAHICFDRTNKAPYRSGGSLYIVHREFSFKPSIRVDLDNSLWGKYSGSFIPSLWPANWWYGNSMPPTDGYESFLPDDNVAGSKGWNKFKPGKPGVSLGQALVELRNIPTVPKLLLRGLGSWKTLPAELRQRHYGYKQLGGDYLNAQFGWVPFLRDLAGLASVQSYVARRLAQLKRDNGQAVRREGNVWSDNDVTVTESSVYHPTYPYVHPFYHTQAGNTHGRRILTKSTQQRTWFCAKFRYYIPDIDTDQGRMRATARLLGIVPSPDLLWEVLPWSWLIDWFANVGDVMSNLSENAAENLVAEYAYVMSEWKLTQTVNESINILSSNGVTPISCESETVQHVKRRSSASPYGFGLNPASLSGKQGLILSALGISRHW